MYADRVGRVSVAAKRTRWELLRSQRNEVLALVHNYELDPFNFEWSYAPSDHWANVDVPALVYKGSSFFFHFDYLQKKHFCTYSPGADSIVEVGRSESWDGQVGDVENWLDCLRNEITQPDLWSQLGTLAVPSEHQRDPFESNEPFSAMQADRLLDALNEMRTYLHKELGELAEGGALVDEKIDYLIEASRRQGRKDWFHTAIGVFAPLFFKLGLDAALAVPAWKILLSGLRGISPLIMP